MSIEIHDRQQHPSDWNEAEGIEAVCGVTATDPADGIEWTCTRGSHDGPHAAHYDNFDLTPYLVAGFVWSDR